MTRLSTIKPQFVEFIPERLDEGVLYVSMQYGTASHKCCCGCGATVVTPITPTDWTLHFDGREISLSPSIGNSALPCRSHYWIDSNRIRWAPSMTDARVAASRDRERRRKDAYYDPVAPPAKPLPAKPAVRGFWSRISRWFGREGSNQ